MRSLGKVGIICCGQFAAVEMKTDIIHWINDRIEGNIT